MHGKPVQLFAERLALPPTTLWESSLPVIRVCRLLMGGNERTHRTR